MRRAGRLAVPVLAAAMAAGACFPVSAWAEDLFDPTTCAVPPALIRVDQPLLRTATRLGRRPFKIVAIGSSSTEGAGASGPAESYPAVLARELARRFPKARIAVYNKGIGGERIDDTIARFKKDVLRLDPDLVIWQVGTNDATADDAIRHFENSLVSGIRELRTKGKDLMLMSLQFSPRMDVHSNQLLYTETIRTVAERFGIQLFRRFDIMDFWIASGQFHVSQLIVGDGLHMSDFGYYCTGVLLADMLETAAKTGEAVVGAPPAPVIPSARAATSER